MLSLSLALSLSLGPPCPSWCRFQTASRTHTTLSRTLHHFGAFLLRQNKLFFVCVLLQTNHDFCFIKASERASERERETARVTESGFRV